MKVLRFWSPRFFAPINFLVLRFLVLFLPGHFSRRCSRQLFSILFLFLTFTLTTRPSPSLPFPQNQTLLSAPTLIGSWRFTKYQYQGQTRPAPNPDLLLIFTFNTDQTSRLYWKRTDENGFCERLARYQIEGSLLRQKIFWTNPKNSLSCGQDPDMQMNRESTTPFLLRENELVLVLELNGDPFYYILEPSSPPPPDEAKF